jgi:uncharacterized protein (TIGR02996 family)
MAATRKPTNKAAKPARRRAFPVSYLRLEKGEGDGRIVWEISRKNTTVTVSQGPPGRAGRTTVKDHGDEARARAAYERAVATRRAEGFEEPADRALVGASSRKGVSARNPELDALIEEDPHDLSRYLIYADWLQQQGDPRGELVVAQHALATATVDGERAKFEEVEARLFKTFAAELLGKLGGLSRVKARSSIDVRGLAWRCGFLRAVRLPRRSAAEAARRLIDHPSARFLEHLAIPAGELIAVREVLRGTMPRTLRSFALNDPYATVSLGPLDVIPEVRRLTTVCSLHRTGPAVLENVEELLVGVGTPATLAGVAKTRWPSLKRLHVTFSVVDAVDVAPTLAEMLRRMPLVEHVSLRRWLRDEDPPPAQDLLAGRILAVLARQEHGIRRLDLEMPLADAAALIPAIRALPASLRLHLPERAIADAPARPARARDLGVVLGDGEPEEPDWESIDAYHHAPG